MVLLGVNSFTDNYFIQHVKIVCYLVPEYENPGIRVQNIHIGTMSEGKQYPLVVFVFLRNPIW